MMHAISAQASMETILHITAATHENPPMNRIVNFTV